MTERLTLELAIGRLEEFWDLDGWFYGLRQGDYVSGSAVEVEAILKAIDMSEDAEIPRRLVSLTWMIPTFMEWQLERVSDRGGVQEGHHETP